MRPRRNAIADGGFGWSSPSASREADLFLEALLGPTTTGLSESAFGETTAAQREADLFWSDLFGKPVWPRRGYAPREDESALMEAPPVAPVAPSAPPAGCTGPATLVDKFPVDQATIDARRKGIIETVATEIVASQGTATPVSIVCVVGHTDATGEDPHNLVLGTKRAAVVEKELRATLDRKSAGLSARLDFRPSSVGESSPVASNATPEGRALNRSVEIFLGRKAAAARVCLKPAISKEDPTALSLFAVGQRELNAGTITVVGRTVPLKLTVFYPATAAGNKTPFATGKGPAPLVVMAHGNHGLFRNPANRTVEVCSNPGGFRPIPNHKGYNYLQTLLARMGVVAISVDCGPTNCRGLSATNIRERAEMIVQTLVFFDGLNKKDPVFKGNLDLTRVGLLGHSRGGEAVLVAAEILAAPTPPVNAKVKGVISLAPTDIKASTGKPKQFAFMAVLPAADGDVAENDGAKFYDQAAPDPFKCQLYIHGASHNLFNREWVNNEGIGPALLSRPEHERILSVYGCAFYRQVLLGQPLLKFLRVDELPPATRNDIVHVSFEQPGAVTIDNHENRNVALNTLGQPTTQAAGLTADEFDFSQGGTKTFNSTFFGNTVGLVAKTAAVAGRFRSSLGSAQDLTGKEVWVRAAEVYDGSSVPSTATGYKLGLEDGGGRVAFVDSNDSGGLPRPYDRRTFDIAAGNPDLTKTILKTQRFPATCFESAPGFNVRDVRAVILQLDRGDKRAIALDQLQIV